MEREDKVELFRALEIVEIEERAQNDLLGSSSYSSSSY